MRTCENVTLCCRVLLWADTADKTVAEEDMGGVFWGPGAHSHLLLVPGRPHVQIPVDDLPPHSAYSHASLDQLHSRIYSRKSSCPCAQDVTPSGYDFWLQRHSHIPALQQWCLQAAALFPKTAKMLVVFGPNLKSFSLVWPTLMPTLVQLTG